MTQFLKILRDSCPKSKYNSIDKIQMFPIIIITLIVIVYDVLQNRDRNNWINRILEKTGRLQSAPVISFDDLWTHKKKKTNKKYNEINLKNNQLRICSDLGLWCHLVSFYLHWNKPFQWDRFQPPPTTTATTTTGTISI